MTGKVAPAPRIISATARSSLPDRRDRPSARIWQGLAAAFAVCYQLERTSHPDFANQCLKNAEHIFALADTSYADPAASVGSGTCNSGCLLTIMPFDGYPETVWDDDMELGATELYFALRSAGGNLPPGLPVTNSMTYLTQAAQFAGNYITKIYDAGYTDTLNLYDVSGLAHFELYRALRVAGNPSGLAVTQQGIRNQLLKQVADAITRAANDAWGFGDAWNSDTTSHGAGIFGDGERSLLLDRIERV